MIHARIPILTLVCALCLIAAPTGGHLAAQSAPDTCWVEGYLFGNDMRPARLRTIEIRKVVKAGYLFTFGTAKPQTDTSGFVRFPVPRGSTAYLYADLPGLRTTLPDGVALAIPNTPTARIETLVPASPVPSSHIVAVPPQRYRVLENGTLKADTIHTLDVSGAIVTSPSPGTAHLQITGGSVVAYGDSIHVADSLARMRRTFISRISTAITLDSSTDGAGRIYYTVSLHPDTVQAWLRDSSMTWMLGRVVQLADSGIAERGYMTPTQIRTLLAGYSVTGHAHAIADVTGLATALGDTVSYRDRMTSVEGSLAVILDTINAVRGRLATVVTDLNTHIARTDNPHQVSAVQTGAPTIQQMIDSIATIYVGTGRKIPWQRIDTTGSFLGAGGGSTFTGLLPFTLSTPTRSWLVYDTTKTDSTFSFGLPVVGDALYGGAARRPYKFSSTGQKWQIGVTGLAAYSNGPNIGNAHPDIVGLVVQPGANVPIVFLNGKNNSNLIDYKFGSQNSIFPVQIRGFAAANPSSLAQTMNSVSLFADTVKVGPGGVSAPNATVSAKAVVGDSAAVKILVFDSTKAIRDSLVWIVKSIDLPIGPYANAARMGSVTFRLIVPGTGVRDFGIVGDTANGVLLSHAIATVTGTYAPMTPFQVWQQVQLYWYQEYLPNSSTGHPHLNKVRADLSKWNNAPAVRRYVFDGSGAYYSQWEIVVNYVMATPASTSTWYVKIVD